MGLTGYRALALAGCAAISLSTALTIPAYAQTVALPEITILGELIERRSQDATTSVGVITNERIQQEQILDFHDALNAAANTLSTRGSSNNSGITIRGINSEGLSQNQSSNSAPVIGVIVDGAMQNAEAVRRGVRSIWDVEQVEILRGPQSTLQGKNAAAGAVLVKTKDPTFSWQAMAEITAGTHDLFSTGIMLSGPLIPNELAFRVAGQIYRAENDIRYTDPANTRLGEDRFGNIRGKILWTPSSIPGLRALFTVAHTDDRPSTNTVTGPDYFARVYTMGLINTSVDFRTTKTNNYISDISYALTGALKIRSITAYAATDTEVSTAPGNIAYIRGDDRRGSDFTQDFRLELENSGNGFSGVAGLFYGDFTTKFNSLVTYAGPLVYQDFAGRYNTKSLAVYADIRYRLDRWVFIAGGRALRDDIKSRAMGSYFNGAIPFDDSTNASFDAFLPKAGVTFDLTSNQTIGFTYQEGYRSGFNDVSNAFGFPQQYSVKPEYLKAYEFSYRSKWMADRLQVNANVFYYDYRDQQVAYEPGLPGLAIITNANKSHLYGAEFETRFLATERLTVYASLGLLWTKFDDVFVPPPGGGNVSGNQFTESPSYTINVGGMYKDPSGFFIGANSRFIDGYFSYGALDNDPLRYVDSAIIVDARLGWEFKSSTLTVFAKNLFDERYLTYIANGGTQAGVGDTRQFGVTWQVRY
ncbi:MAG TPA: TonB-dependent receptor [Xanthobacteraceae bacterium]|nr:TonB-dependent receptor [Xanthobacteraceae bacterium]